MKTIIALDVGKKISGYALFDADSKRFLSSGTLTFLLSGEGIVPELNELCAENAAEVMVVGMPFHTETGKITQEGRGIIRFIQRIEKSFEQRCTIVFVDESFTSLESAESLSINSRKKRKGKKRAGMIDKSAATLIGKRYLQGEPFFKIYSLAQCVAMMDDDR